MASLSLVFDILAQDHASNTFRSVGDEAEKTGKRAEGGLGLIGKAAGAAGGLLLAGGIVEGFKKLYDAAAESQKIGRLTAQVIESTGGAANITAGQVSKLATAISNKSGIDDEAIQSSENLLLTFTNVRNEAGKGNDIFNQATQAVTDMSVALGQDGTTSAIQLGKALNDPIKGVTALQKVGVSFTSDQKDQIKALVDTGNVMGAQKVILGELTKEFGGAAAAAATPLDKLKTALGNAAEDLGNYVIPVVDKFATFITDRVLPGVEKVGHALGGVLGPVLHTVFGAMDDLVSVGGKLMDFWDKLPGPVKVAIGVMGGISALKGPIGGVFDSIKGAAETAALKVLYAKDTIGGLGGAGGIAKAGLGNLVGFLGGPWGLAIEAASIGLSLLIGWLGKTSEADKKTKQATQDYAQALDQANGAIDVSVTKAAAKAAQDSGLLDVAQKMHMPLTQVTDAITHQGTALGVTRDQLKAFIDEHTRTVPIQGAHGEIDGVRQVIDEEGQAGKRALDSLNSLSGQTGKTAGDQQQLASATGQAAGGMDDAAAKARQLQADLKDTATEASDARSQTDLFKTSLDELTGKNVSLLQVQSDLQGALAQATQAMKDDGGAVKDASGALNEHTENGRKATDVLFGVKDAGDQLIATMIQQGGTTQDVNKADSDLRNSFIDSAKQMGFNQDEAQKLADKILGIPAERSTTITADTAQATQAADDLQKKIDALHGREVSIMARTVMPDLNGPASGNGRMGTFSAGGYTGPGGKFTPAGLVHAGEVVFSQEDVSAHGGVSAVEAFRQWRPTGYANGGPVGPIGITAVLDTRTYEQEMDAGAFTFLRNILSMFAPGPGGSVERWRPMVDRVLGELGITRAADNGVLQIISHESGGNPNAINLTDSNARAGHPSQGLMQTIPATFARWAGPYRGLGITNPLANIFAGVNYALHTYGLAMLLAGGRHSPGPVSTGTGGGNRGTVGHYIGYANGGVIGEPITGIGDYSGRSYRFGENGPETVTPGVRGHGNTYVTNVTVDRDADLIARKIQQSQREREFLHG